MASDRWRRPNVHLIVIDTRSRFSFGFTMKRTAEFLRSLAKSPQSGVRVFEFKRHNIVVRATFVPVA